MEDPVHLWDSRWNIRCLSCRHAFFLVLLLLLAALALLGVELWKDTNRQWQKLHTASDSLMHHQKLSLLLQEVIEYEQLTHRFLLGDRFLAVGIESAKKRIDEAMQQIVFSTALFSKEEDSDPAAAHVPLPIDQITNSWKMLSQSEGTPTLELNLAENLKIVQAIRDCLKILQERIILSGQEDLVTLLLNQLLYLQLPALQQDIMRFASLGEQLAYSQEPSITMRHHFIGTMALMGDQEERIQINGNRAMHLQYILNHDPSLQAILKNPFAELHDAIRNWIQEVTRSFTQNTLTFEPFILLATHALDESVQLTGTLIEQIEHLLNQQISAWNKAATSRLILFALTCLLILGLVCFLFYNILSALKKMLNAAQSIQKGNLQAHFPLNITEELSTQSAVLNSIGASIQDLFRAFHHLKLMSKDSFQSIATLFEKQNHIFLEQKAMNHQLLLQAQTLVSHAQTSTTAMQEALVDIEQMFSTIKHGKDFLRKFIYMIENLFTSSQELTNALSPINEHDQNATHLISSMTQVTDRTNLLSLNAAIKAKKTGDGFGVIADEVRRLADQTAHTTLDIEQMLHHIISSMKSSHQSIQHLFAELDAATQQIKPFDNTFLMLHNQIQQQLMWLKKMQEQVETEESVSESMMQTIHPMHRTTQQTAQIMEQLRAECLHFSEEIDKLSALLAPFELH